MITEYNPFHNGHKYHLEKSLEMTGADYSVAVMSGNFTQRGEAAILDKWTRSRLAVENGVDLVLELPFIFACNRGEIFASGAVDILSRIGVTDIVFGSECGDVECLKALAEAISLKARKIDDTRRQHMKGGISYAKAFQLAVEEILGKEMAGILNDPNNILAVEYLKRIFYQEKRGHAIRAFTVKRIGAGYHSFDEASGFAGASAVRKMISEGIRNESELKRYMPENSAEAILKGADLNDIEEKVFFMLKGELIRRSADELSQIYCMGEGIENKFRKEAVKASGMQEFISHMVSKRYTEAAVKRLIIYMITGMEKKHNEKSMPLYARVLAAGVRGRELLRFIKNNEDTSIPVITNVNREWELASDVMNTLTYDMIASDIYNLISGRDLYKFSDRVARPYIV